MGRTQTDGAGEVGGGVGTFVPAFVDHLLPMLKPYEAVLYLYLYRHTHAVGVDSVRVGLRKIARDCGRGTRSESGGNIQHIREVLTSLESKGCIRIADKTREGALYLVRPVEDIEGVAERLATEAAPPEPRDYYRDAELRRALFERDGWRCRYCGDAVTEATATLDHRVPVSLGGLSTEDNLATACLMCNSLKSGRTAEEAAPRILESIRSRRAERPKT